MKQILLTGASGFIGRNIAEGLQDQYIVLCPSSEELDLLDSKAVSRFFQLNSIDVVIHAANCNERKKKIVASEVLDKNLRMFFNLERCKSLYGKMLYFGSGAEYDMQNYIPNMPEEHFDVNVPKDAYGFSKYIMAKSCLKSDNIFDLCLFGVYGKYEEWNRRFISNAICRALKGMEITIRQNVYFDYLWIEDLIKVLPYFIENDLKYKRYNVCRGKKIDLYSLAVVVKKILNVDCEIKVKESGWKPEYTGNNCRMLNAIGKVEFTELEDTIETLCLYYREHLDEIDKNML